MSVVRWRVAVTRDDKGDDAVSSLLEDAGFTAVPVPVLVEGPAPDPQQLIETARRLESFDWIICASVRAVRAITRARGSQWPAAPRTAAVGSVTAAAMRDAGASNPIVAQTFTAQALWQTLRPLDAWPGRRVLVTTVDGGRRDLIDGLREQGAEVTELEAYTMAPRDRADVRTDWETARPDAVILGSAATARHLVDAIGVAAIRDLRAIVPIGPTTAATLHQLGLTAEAPARATYAAAVERLQSLLK